jgi:RNA recognition motif-containing protein
VEYSNPSEAQSAANALDGTEFQGRNLKVNEARQRPQENRGGGGSKFRRKY